MYVRAGGRARGPSFYFCRLLATCLSSGVVVAALDCAPVHAMAQAKEESVASQMAVELKRNRELTTKLYVLRGDALPNDHR